jgi:hypothetical protein
MPINRKTSKALAGKRAAPAMKQADGEPKREVSGIRSLVSRWHWLEADQTHRSNIAKTEKESERLIAIHNDEQKMIEGALSLAVPANFSDVCCLLEFATSRVKQGGCMADRAEIAMLQHVREGLSLAWNDELKAGELAIRRALDMWKSA